MNTELLKNKTKTEKATTSDACCALLVLVPSDNPATIWTPPDLFFSRAPLMNRETRVTTDPRRLSITSPPGGWIYLVLSTMREFENVPTQFKVCISIDVCRHTSSSLARFTGRSLCL